MKKRYAVIDTNVVVSAALKHSSIPGAIIDLAFNGQIIPVLNREIESEYRNVLARPKFHLTKDIIEAILDSFHETGLYIEAEELEIILPDSKDIVFYEVVMEERKSEDAYLVTGNIKHFPIEPFIVTPRQMLDIVLNDVDEI